MNSEKPLSDVDLSAFGKIVENLDDRQRRDVQELLKDPGARDYVAFKQDMGVSEEAAQEQLISLYCG